MAYRYRAFISYRHVEPDRGRAIWLHRALETFRTPKRLIREQDLPPRIGRVFRDEDELAASADLGREVEKALDDSEFLIVVCSRSTPESRWVNQEVQYFRDRGRDDRVLALLIDGEPADAFPPALCQIRRAIVEATGHTRQAVEEVEPLAADLRPRPDESRRTIERWAKLKLLAVLLGTRFDDLRQREQERRTRRLQITVAIMAVLTLVFTLLTWFAFSERTRAENNADVAERRRIFAESQTRLANAQRLAAQSQLLRAEQPRLAALLSFEAIRTTRDAGESVVPEAVMALREAIRPMGLQCITGHDAEEQRWNIGPTVAVTPDGRHLVTGGTDGRVGLWLLADGRVTGESLELGDLGEAVELVAVDPTGRFAVAKGDEAARVWDLGAADLAASGRPLAGMEGWVPRLAFSPDGRSFATVGGWPHQFFDLDANAPHGVALGSRGKATTDLVASLAGHRLALGYKDGSVDTWDLASPRPLDDVERLAAHDAPVEVVAVSASGSRIAAADDQGDVRVWTRAGEEWMSTSLPGPQRELRVIVFGRVRNVLLTGAEDRSVRAWDLEGDTPTVLWEGTPPGDREIKLLKLSADDAWVEVVREDLVTHLRKMDAGTNAAPWVSTRGTGRWLVQSFFGPNGRWLLHPHYNGSIWLYDLHAADPGAPAGVLRGHEGVTSWPVFSPDGRWMYTGSNDGTLRIWDARDPRRARSPIEFSLSEHAGFVSYGRSSDDRFVLRRSKERYTVWDLSDPAPEPATCWIVKDPNETYWGVWISRGGQWLVARISRGVVLFDLAQTGELTPAVATPAFDYNMIVEEAVLDGDGETLYCGHRDGRISVWDVRSGPEAALRGIHAGHEGEILTLCLDPNEHWLASAAKDGTVRLWDARAEFGDASGPVLPFPKKFDMLRFGDVLRFAGRSRWLLTPGGLVWDLEAERPADTQRAIGGGDADVLDIDPSDRWVVMVRDRGGALAYDLERSDPWSEPRRIALDGSQCGAWAFDPRGRRFAAGLGSGYIHVWDLLVEDAAAAKTVIDSHRRVVQGLAFSPDGRRLVSASWDTTVRIWNVEAEEPATTEVVLHTGPAGIGHVQFSRDGRWLVTGGGEGEVLFWHHRVEELLQIARDIVGRNLAPEEWSRFFGATPYRRTFPELPQGQIDRALLLGR